MFKIKTTSIERKIKYLIPQKLKQIITNFLTSSLFGRIIKLLNPKFNLFNGYYNFSLVKNKEAAKIFFGIYESAEIRFVKRFVKNKIIIEIGSSIGVTLGVILKSFFKKNIFCIEPSKKNFGILKKINIEFGNDNVKLINSAIDYSGRKHVLFKDASYTSSKIMAYKKNFNNSTYKVKTITLGEVIKKYQIKKYFTLIMDIEGSEASIFFKDAKSLNLCNQIICELHACKNFSIEDLVKKIQQINFILVERYNNVFYFKKN
jgi:FkbM family methyltransferase